VLLLLVLLLLLLLLLSLQLLYCFCNKMQKGPAHNSPCLPAIRKERWC
jgi:hypothetical protein